MKKIQLVNNLTRPFDDFNIAQNEINKRNKNAKKLKII